MLTQKSCMRLITVLFFIFGIKAYAREIPQLDSLTLNSGLKVYLLQYGEEPVLSLKLIINGGKKSESECQVGYSDIVQQLINEFLNEKQGSFLKKENRFSCETINGQTILKGNCLNTELDKKIELLCTTLCRLSFTRDKMDRIVSTVCEDLDTENMSALQLSDIFKNLLFYGIKHPLGRTYCQYQVQKVLPEELRLFYGDNYTPARSSILICGNFNINVTKKIIAKHFIKWRQLHEETKEEITEPKIPKFKNKEIAFVNKQSSQGYTLQWIKPAPAPKSPDYTAFLAVCSLFNGFLKESLRNEIEDFDSLKLTPIAYTGDLIEVNCVTNQTNILKSVQLFDSTLKRFHQLKITQSALEKTIKKIKSNYLKYNDPESILSFYDPLIYDFASRTNYLITLSGINLLNIQTVIDKYFTPDAYKLIIVGKEHLISDKLTVLKNVAKYAAADFETCNDACKEVVIFKCHCESCYNRGYCNIWRFNPNQKEAIKSAKEKVK